MKNHKRPILIVSLLGVVLAALLFYSFKTIISDRKYYQNPLPVSLGDPFILNDGKNYYMYGTDESGSVNGFSAYESKDMIHWSDKGVVYEGGSANSWTVKNYWAPEVYKKNGKYYMFFSADWKYNPKQEAENFRIGVAVADTPLGPFKEISDKPLFDPGYPIIDANVLEYQGKTYLYYSRCCYKNPVESEVSVWAKKINLFQQVEESWVYGVEIASDFTKVIGTPVLLLQPPQKMNDEQSEWESRSVTTGEVNRRWTEGSCAFAVNNKIYMMYSANFFGGKNYAVGYATSNQPLGPFEKASNNPVIQKNTDNGGIVTGTGHNNIVKMSGKQQIYCVYHGRTNETGDKRVVFIDKLNIDKRGYLHVEGPTTNRQKID